MQGNILCISLLYPIHCHQVYVVEREVGWLCRAFLFYNNTYFSLVLAYFCTVLCTFIAWLRYLQSRWHDFNASNFPIHQVIKNQLVDGAITPLLIAGVHSYRDFLPNSENKMGAHIQVYLVIPFNTSNPLIEGLYRIICCACISI